MEKPKEQKPRPGSLYASVWRWHLYAGLFVIPFVLLLSISGAFYLFKPQVERFEERAFQNLPVAAPVSAQQQVLAALAAFPGAVFGNYRLPASSGDAAMVTLRLADGPATRQVFVAPEGQVLGSLDPSKRLMEIAKNIHSSLLLGTSGRLLVELAASWAFVLMASGLYLWWPRGRRLAGVLWPRLDSSGRVRWRDLHAVTAFWLFGFIAVLLLTSLPWTRVWGGAFQTLRMEMGWVSATPEWIEGGTTPEGALAVLASDPHAGHHGGIAHSMARMQQLAVPASLDSMVKKARSAELPFPVFVSPPQGLGRFGVATGAVWTIYSDTQNRPRQQTLTFASPDDMAPRVQSYDGGDRINRVIGYGIAWHEGQLFGWANQLAGLLTAVGLVLMAVSGFLLWRRRPALPRASRTAPPARIGGALAILLGLAALLPLLALSLTGLLLFDRLLLPSLVRWFSPAS